MSEQHTDVIVVGLGLAGLAVCETFRSRGKTVLAIDEKAVSSASRVAAGLWNPVAFRQMKHAWRADEFFPVAEAFYSGLEELLSINCWHKKGIVRVFGSSEERERWEQNKHTAPYSGWMMENNPDLSGLPIKAPEGYGALHHAGYLNTNLLLDAYRDFLAKQDALLDATFDYDQLEIATDGVRYQGHSADKIIFCEGAGIAHNPWFNDRGYRLKKGEVLSLEVKNLPLNIILNHGIFLMPLGGDEYRLGSTFNQGEFDLNITERAKEELLQKLAKFIDIEPKVTAQRAGLRPSSNDRKPIIGPHQEYPALVLFNGMAARGVTQSPFLAGHLYEHLYEGINLDQEVDLYRYQKQGKGKGGGQGKGKGKGGGRNR